MAEDVVGSKMPGLASEGLKPSKAGYGQNGYAGASSDLPGEHTTSGFLPGVSAADLSAALKGNPSTTDAKQPKFAAPQTRDVSSESYPLSFGMDKRTTRNS